MQLQMVTVPLDEMSLNADNHTYKAVFSSSNSQTYLRFGHLFRALLACYWNEAANKLKS